jgi:muconolactone delta-isomerase
MPMLSTVEAATRLKLTRDHVSKLCRKGTLKATWRKVKRPGGWAWFVAGSSVERLVRLRKARTRV